MSGYTFSSHHLISLHNHLTIQRDPISLSILLKYQFNQFNLIDTMLSDSFKANTLLLSYYVDQL